MYKLIYENLQKYYSIKEQIFIIEDKILDESLNDIDKSNLMIELESLKEKTQDLFLSTKKEETGLTLLH